MLYHKTGVINQIALILDNFVIFKIMGGNSSKQRNESEKKDG